MARGFAAASLTEDLGGAEAGGRYIDGACPIFITAA
jgi:hypothetical protein